MNVPASHWLGGAALVTTTLAILLPRSTLVGVRRWAGLEPLVDGGSRAGSHELLGFVSCLLIGLHAGWPPWAMVNSLVLLALLLVVLSGLLGRRLPTWARATRARQRGKPHEPSWLGGTLGWLRSGWLVLHGGLAALFLIGVMGHVVSRLYFGGLS